MKTIFVLYSSKTAPSGRALSRKMIESCPADYKVCYGTSSVLSKVIRQNGNHYPDYIVNMGEFRAEVKTRLQPTGTPVVLNHPGSVGKSSNKRGSRIKFREAEVPAPLLWEHSPADIPTKEYPVVGRTTNHSKAHGFWFCRNRTEAVGAARAGATHFLKFIPDTKEYRLHIIAATKKEDRKKEDYVSIKMSEKIFSAAKKKSGYDIIKNHGNGWVFMSPKAEPRAGLFKEMRQIAKQAVSLFGLDWGAVDIMYDSKTDKIYVLEINSSPCLTDATANTLTKYSEWILHLCGAIKKDLAKYEVAKAVAQTAKVVAKTITKKKSRSSDEDIIKGFVRRMGL